MRLESWIDDANLPQCDFPVENLPYGTFDRGQEPPRCGVAIGKQVLDLAVLEEAGLIETGSTEAVFSTPGLNAFMALGPRAWDSVRRRLIELLVTDGDPVLSRDLALRTRALAPRAEVRLHLPFTVAEYTDFYACRQHAMNVGSILRGGEPALSPNWLHMPLAYNGRASTVVVSGTDIRRPWGQTRPADGETPVFGPSGQLDVEMELGVVVGVPSVMGRSVTVGEAEEMIFGYVLLNDWSARDIQAWEYRPLGPFQAKAFATSISPWVVTRAALEPFRVATPPREVPLLAYLREPAPLLYDIDLTVALQPAGAPRMTVISRTNYRYMYYSAAQLVTHHAVGGCKMSVGDLLGSGTISGPDPSQFGSLLELTWGGRRPLTLETGESRGFVEDGDRLTLRGWARADGYRVGFGECANTILPAHPRDGG